MIQQNWQYKIEMPGFSVGFSGTPNLTVNEIRARLERMGIPLPDLTDTEWDEAVTRQQAARTDLAALPGWATWTASGTKTVAGHFSYPAGN